MNARRRLALGLLTAATLSVAVALVAQVSDVVHATEQRAVAARFAIRGASTPDDMLLVTIDDATFSDLQRQWPFPRSLHAKAIDVLHAARAREIVYDVQFTEPTTAREDGALYDAVGRAGGAVLATSESDAQGRTAVLGGDENLRAVDAEAAAANLPDDFGAVLSHFPYAVGALPSLATATARRVGQPVPRSAFDGDGAWIDFRGPPGTIESVSFSALIDGRVDPTLIHGRIVVVGASAPSLQDVHSTPTAAAPMSGAEIQANAIWTVLHGVPLRDAPLPIEVMVVVLLGVAVPLLRLRLRVLAAAAVGVLLAAALLVGSQLAFDHGIVTWVSAPLLAVVAGTLTMVLVSHLSESFERRRVSRDNEILEARVRERTQELRETQLEILQRLSRAAEWRDGDTGKHIIRMARLSQALAAAIGLSPADTETLGHAAVAHDIGKIAIPDRILLKPGKLTPEERKEMEQHASIGASMLSGSRSAVMQLAETIALTHHERWDGSGYPRGLRGTEIPLPGRICALCDVFDALMSERPYKRPWSLSETLAEIRAQSGRQFDPDLVEVFTDIASQLCADLYPERTERVGHPDDAAPIGGRMASEAETTVRVTS